MPSQFGPIEDMEAWRDGALSEIDERTVVCSSSDGKDSTATALLLHELDFPTSTSTRTPAGSIQPRSATSTTTCPASLVRSRS